MSQVVVLIANKAQGSTNVIIFATLLIAGLILTTWYISSVRPNKLLIGSLTDDAIAIERHMVNACSSNEYSGRYAVHISGELTVNGDELCITSQGLTICRSVPCSTTPAQFNYTDLLHITRSSGDIEVSP